MTTIKTVLLSTAMLFVFAGCGGMQVSSSGMLPSPEGAYAHSSRSQSKEIEVVFYRLTGDKKHVATVKAGGNVVGSLLPGHYAKTRACQDRLIVGVAERGDIINVTHYNPKVGGSNIVYMRVSGPSGGRFGLTQVDAKLAEKEIASLKLKSNVINRHVPSCSLSNHRSVILKSVTLGTYALFAFNKTDLKSKNSLQLNELISDIKLHESRIEGLQIVGYTDAIGSENYNLALSEQRAQSVAEYLRLHGVAMPIKTVGFGESDPVSQGCSKLAFSEMKQCMQTDRRVTVNLMIRKLNPINTKIPAEFL